MLGPSSGWMISHIIDPEYAMARRNRISAGSPLYVMSRTFSGLNVKTCHGPIPRRIIPSAVRSRSRLTTQTWTVLPTKLVSRLVAV